MSDNEPKVCERCRVIAVCEPDSGRWAHPLQFQEKFSLSVCDGPIPGRPAKTSEIRYGRGRNYLSDKYTLTGSIPELEQDPTTPLTVGVDGSYKLITGAGRIRKPMSWAYLTTDGRYGLGTSTVPGKIVGYQRPTQAELRAIWWALVHTPRSHPVRIVTDSLDAVELMAAWRDGEMLMPEGYTTERSSGREATLVQLAKLVHEDGDRITVEKVRSHTGHPLNEGADALAKMARALAVGRLTKDVVAGDARRAVLGALTRYATLL